MRVLERDSTATTAAVVVMAAAADFLSLLLLLSSSPLSLLNGHIEDGFLASAFPPLMMDHNNFTIKTYMAIMAERDAAIRERNMALEERKRAFAERDMAMLQRDAALAERNALIQERNDAIAALRLQDSSTNDNNMVPDSPGNGTESGAKHIYNQQQMYRTTAEAAHGSMEDPSAGYLKDTDTSEAKIPKKVKRPKESRHNKQAKIPRVGKIGTDSLSMQVIATTSDDWANLQEMDSDKEGDTQLTSWKDNLGFQINFDESAMPVPVCSCTGTPQPCYKWGHGGWQSACCTTTISMYPLPQISNKRYSRVGGRKMSGGAFSKLLNRLAAQGYDLSIPLDLKDHWAKHGTNRYSTLK